MLDSRRAESRPNNWGFCFARRFFSSLNLNSYSPFLPGSMCQRLGTNDNEKRQKQKGWMVHLLSTRMFQIIVELEGTQCFRNISLLSVATFIYSYQTIMWQNVDCVPSSSISSTSYWNCYREVTTGYNCCGSKPF